jgi:hypothetical protein
MIKKIKQFVETQTSILQKKAGIFNEEDVVECAIDDQIVRCEDLEAPVVECGPGHLTQGYGWFGGRSEGYTGTVPAPKVLTEDPWFGHSPMSTKQLSYVKEQLYQEEMRHKCMSFEPKEPENIHHVMYEMATKSGATTVQLNPIGGSENFQGGSEIYHEQSYTRSI